MRHKLLALAFALLLAAPLANAEGGSWQTGYQTSGTCTETQLDTGLCWYTRWVALPVGRGNVTVSGTWDSGQVTLKQLGPDGNAISVSGGSWTSDAGDSMNFGAGPVQVRLEYTVGTDPDLYWQILPCLDQSRATC